MARHRRRSQYFSRRPTRGVRGRRHRSGGGRRRRRKGESLSSKQKQAMKERTKELVIDELKWQAVSAPPTLYAGAQIRKSVMSYGIASTMKRPGTVPPRGMPSVVKRRVGKRAAQKAGIALGVRLGIRVAGHFAGPFAIAFWAYDIYTIGKWVSER